MRKTILGACAVILAGASIAISQEGSTDDFQSNIFGNGAIEAGQVLHGQHNQGVLDHQWIEQAILHAGIEAIYNERLRMTAVIEGLMFFPVPYHPEASERPAFSPVTRLTVYQADGTYALLGPLEKPLLRIGAGLFPFKYNPLAANLGEYLFRSAPYPCLTMTHFDGAFARILGFQASSEIPEIGLKLNAILSSELVYWPLMDISVAGLAGFKPLDFIDLGAGVNFYHLISVESGRTTPKIFNNQIPYTGADSNKVEYYTFAGTLLDMRAALDLKIIPRIIGILPEGIFGEKDLWIYGETAILGAETYKFRYDTLYHRIPIMFGVNAPMFRLIDVCSVEFEYWNNPHVNSFRGIWGAQLPIWPQEKDPNIIKSKWRWSVYAKKSVLNDHVQFMFQIGRDHTFLQSFITAVTVADAEEALKSGRDVAWKAKIQFNY